MDIYPWWTEAHKAFAQKMVVFAEEILPLENIDLMPFLEGLIMGGTLAVD